MGKMSGAILRAIMKAALKRTPIKPYAGGTLECGQWYDVPLAGSICANGEPNPLFVRKGAANKLVIYFYGGGLFWKSEDAWRFGTQETLFDPDYGYCTGETRLGNAFWSFVLNSGKGLFSDAPARSPFTDWTIVAINYGTGDFHVGQTEYTVTDKRGVTKTMKIQGYRNFQLAMDYILRLSPNPEQLLICGESAGGFGVSLLASDILDAYPECKNITVCSDASLLHYDWSTALRDVWNAPEHIRNRVTTDNLVADCYRDLVARYSDRARFLFLCGVRDIALAQYANAMDGGERKPTKERAYRFQKELKNHVAALKAADPKFGIYIHNFSTKNKADCVQHMTLMAPSFSERKIDGITPSKWLKRAVIDGQVSDIGLHLLNE